MDWHTLVGELDVGAEPADRPEVGIWRRWIWRRDAGDIRAGEGGETEEGVM